MEIPTPQSTAPIETAGRGRKASDEPNPFLDNGWLWEQYEAVKASEERKESVVQHTKSVTVPGAWEDVQATNRKREPMWFEDGAPVMISKLVGDAATVVRLIRKAADLQEIGVSVQAVPAVNARGKEIKGQVEVKYLAKDRTIKTRKGQNADGDDNGDDTVSAE